MFEAGALIWRIQSIGAQVLKQDLKDVDQSAQKASKSLGDASKKTEELGGKAPKVRTVRDELRGMSNEAQQASRQVGGSLLAIGAGVTALAALTVKAAIDWETAWTGVRKTVDGTPEELAAIEVGLRGLSGVLPASHDEIAAVAEAAGQLGVKSKDIVGFTKTMIDLGETTNLTSDEAATSLAQLMNIFQTAPDQVDNLASALVALGNNGASTERDIVQMAQRIAGAGKIVGLTEGETLGLANALASVGIEAEAGGSSVSNIMIDIATAVSTKGAKLLEWAKLAGLSADDFAAKFKAKPAEALALVIEGMGRLNATGGDVFGTLTALGQTDVRVTRSLLGLAGSGDLLRESLELGNTAAAEGTALQEEAAKRYETTAAKIEIARNAVVDMAIDLGETLLPTVKAVAEGVTLAAGAIGGLPPELQNAIAVSALLGGGLLVLGGILLLTVPRIVEFRAAMALLTKEMPQTTAAGGKFIAGLAGWGAVLAVVSVAVNALFAYVAAGQATLGDFENALKRGASAADLLRLAAKSDPASTALWGDYYESLQKLPELLDKTKSGTAALDLTMNELGAVDSLDRLGRSLADLATTDLPTAQSAFKDLVTSYNLTQDQQLQLLETMPAFREALVGQATAMGINVTSGDEFANSQAILKIAMAEGAAATGTATEAYVAAQDSVTNLQDELDRLIDTINAQNDLQGDVVSTNAAWQSALAGITDEVQSQKDAYEQTYGSLDGFTASLDANTEAGSAAQEMLRQTGDAAREAAEAQYQADLQTMSAEEATQKYVATLGSNRQALIDAAVAAGFNAEQVQALTDKVYQVPDKRKTDFLVETAYAAQQIQTFIDGQSGRTIWLNVATSYAYNSGSVGGIPQANGGHVKFFADGGENHVAQFARAGEWRVWAEPETKGEWYFPDAPEKRPRAVAYAEQMLDGWGYQMVPKGSAAFSGGGTTVSSSTVRSEAPIPITIPVSIDGYEFTRVLIPDLREFIRANSGEGS